MGKAIEKTACCKSVSISDISALELVVNMRIAEAESLGIYFPSGALFGIYQAFESISLVGDPESAAIYDFREAVSEQVDLQNDESVVNDLYDQAHAMLCVSYVHAVAVIAGYYYEEYSKLNDSTGDFDILKTKYATYSKIDNLERAHAKYVQALQQFDYDFIDDDENEFMSLFFEVRALSIDERARLLDSIDDWRNASQELFDARRSAQDIFDKALSEVNAPVVKANRFARIVSAVLLSAGVLQIALKMCS